MIDNEKLKEEARKVFDSVAGVEDTEEFYTFYDEDNVPLLDVVEQDNKIVLWFHETDNKYIFDDKVVLDELFK